MFTKRLLFLFLTAFYSILNFAQVNFEEGYLIDMEGVRSEVLIRNADWRFSPVTIKYKENESANVLESDLQNIIEFGFANGDRYIKRKVKIDFSSNTAEKLSYSSLPQWEEKTVFLKAVVEGLASLYIYENRKFNRFFITKDNNQLEQLIYKRYKVSETQIAHNYQFRTQVKKLFSCSGEDDFSNIMYTEKALNKVLINYNDCNQAPYKTYVSDKEKTKFKFGLHLGINRGALFVEDTRFGSALVDLSRSTTFRGGLHFELVLPFNRNKWSLVFQPSYHYYRRSEDLPGSIALFDNSVEITNKSIELPLGLRYYTYLNDDAAIFLNAFLVYDFIMESEMAFERYHGTYTNEINANALAFGIGARFKGISVECRFTGNRDIFVNRVLFVQYNVLSAIASYNF